MRFSCYFLGLWALCMSALPVFSQFSGSITVNGTADNYYPVTFYDGSHFDNAATELEIGRSAVHTAAIQWHGSIISKFTFHSTNWGNGSNFINADIRQRTNFKTMIGGWAESSNNNGTRRIIIWMRGNTFYYYRANSDVAPVVYDGVQNALPFDEVGGISHNVKTTPDAYVNTMGMSYSTSAFFNGGLPNYFGGNVGIGTPAPFGTLTNQGLHIQKGDHSTILLGNPATGGHGGVVQTSDNMQRVFVGANMYDDPVNSWRTFQSTKGSAGISVMGNESAIGAQIVFYANQVGGTFTSRMVINGNGNVSIGTTAQTSYKLAVDGTIGARKVKVTQENWPDYVFAPSYSLMPLAQLESFIGKHQHLPEIPSAAEVEKNGLDLGDNQAQLLKKIEELTLYIIELNKKLEAVKTRLKAVEEK